MYSIQQPLQKKSGQPVEMVGGYTIPDLSQFWLVLVRDEETRKVLRRRGFGWKHIFYSVRHMIVTAQVSGDFTAPLQHETHLSRWKYAWADVELALHDHDLLYAIHLEILATILTNSNFEKDGAKYDAATSLRIAHSNKSLVDIIDTVCNLKSTVSHLLIFLKNKIEGSRVYNPSGGALVQALKEHGDDELSRGFEVNDLANRCVFTMHTLLLGNESAPAARIARGKLVTASSQAIALFSNSVFRMSSHLLTLTKCRSEHEMNASPDRRTISSETCTLQWLSKLASSGCVYASVWDSIGITSVKKTCCTDYYRQVSSAAGKPLRLIAMQVEGDESRRLHLLRNRLTSQTYSFVQYRARTRKLIADRHDRHLYILNVSYLFDACARRWPCRDIRTTGVKTALLHQRVALDNSIFLSTRPPVPAYPPLPVRIEASLLSALRQSIEPVGVSASSSTTCTMLNPVLFFEQWAAWLKFEQKPMQENIAILNDGDDIFMETDAAVSEQLGGFSTEQIYTDKVLMQALSEQSELTCTHGDDARCRDLPRDSPRMQTGVSEGRTSCRQELFGHLCFVLLSMCAPDAVQNTLFICHDKLIEDLHPGTDFRNSILTMRRIAHRHVTTHAMRTNVLACILDVAWSYKQVRPELANLYASAADQHWPDDRLPVLLQKSQGKLRMSSMDRTVAFWLHLLQADRSLGQKALTACCPELLQVMGKQTSGDSENDQPLLIVSGLADDDTCVCVFNNSKRRKVLIGNDEPAHVPGRIDSQAQHSEVNRYTRQIFETAKLHRAGQLPGMNGVAGTLSMIGDPVYPPTSSVRQGVPVFGAEWLKSPVNSQMSSSGPMLSDGIHRPLAPAETMQQYVASPAGLLMHAPGYPPLQGDVVDSHLYVADTASSNATNNVVIDSVDVFDRRQQSFPTSIGKINPAQLYQPVPEFVSASHVHVPHRMPSITTPDSCVSSWNDLPVLNAFDEIDVHCYTDDAFERVAFPYQGPPPLCNEHIEAYDLKDDLMKDEPVSRDVMEAYFAESCEFWF
jgi:hypothetical protein